MSTVHWLKGMPLKRAMGVGGVEGRLVDKCF